MPFEKKIGFKTLNLIFESIGRHARKTFARSLLLAAEEAERERIREKVFLSLLIAFLLQNHGRGGKAPVEEEAREGEEEEE